MAIRKLDPESPKASIEQRRGRDLRRWIIPFGGGLLAAILIVLSTPHVAWYLRLPLGLLAFAYVSGQSAAYLWTHDQGD
jgi:hypothetical protein